MITKCTVNQGGAAPGNARWLCWAVYVILLDVRVSLTLLNRHFDFGKVHIPLPRSCYSERDKFIWVHTFNFSWRHIPNFSRIVWLQRIISTTSVVADKHHMDQV